MRRRLTIKQEPLDELGAPLHMELLCPTVSKTWLSLPPHMAANGKAIAPLECDRTRTEFEV